MYVFLICVPLLTFRNARCHFTAVNCQLSAVACAHSLYYEEGRRGTGEELKVNNYNYKQQQE